MDLKNHCLFCLEQIAPYCIPSLSSSSVSFNHGCPNIGEESDANIPTFQSLCSYLKISPPKDGSQGGTRSCKGRYAKKMSVLPSTSTWTSTCDEFLCIWCFEMADQLSKLCKEFEELQRKIEEMTGRIREVVMSHDISANSASNKERRDEFKEKVGGSSQSGAEYDSVAFVDMFQKWVQGADVNLTNNSNIKKDSRKRPASPKIPNEKRTRSKTVKTSETSKMSPMDDEDMGEVKIEVTEEDLKVVKPEEEIFLDDLNAFNPGTPDSSENSFKNTVNTTAGKEESNDKKDEEELKPRSANEVDADKPKIVIGTKTLRIKLKKTFRNKTKTVRKTSSTSSSTKTKSNRIPDKPLKLKCRDKVVEPEEDRFQDELLLTREHTEKSMEIPSVTVSDKEEEESNDDEGEEDDDWRPSRCKRRQSSRIKLKNSRKKSRKIKCPECDLRFTSYFALRSHRTRLHFRDKSIVDALAIPTLTATGRPSWRRPILIKICTICGLHVKEYNGNGRLLKYMEHMLSHEESATPEYSGLHSCDECDKTFVLKINYDLHKACIHDSHQMLITCDYCTGVFKTREKLIEHLKAEHSETVHSCKHCPMSFTSLDKLLAHMVNHSASKRLECSECDLGIFQTMRELRQHCHDCHPNLITTYSCQFCDKYYFKTDFLQRHLKYAHNYNSESKTTSEEAVFQCEQCNNGKLYKTKPMLEKHIKYNHSEARKYKCDECDRTFVFKGALLEHVRRSHEKVRYPCPHCPKTYADQYQLECHLKTHTGEGLLTCHICSRQFSRTQQLNVHLRTHDKMGPEDMLVCDVCGKEVLGKVKLDHHRRSHSDKRYECPVCGIKMKRSDHVKSHLRTHTGERPFVCPVCSKGFNRRDILRIHVKGVHGQVLSEIVAKEANE